MPSLLSKILNFFAMEALLALLTDTWRISLSALTIRSRDICMWVTHLTSIRVFFAWICRAWKTISIHQRSHFNQLFRVSCTSLNGRGDGTYSWCKGTKCTLRVTTYIVSICELSFIIMIHTRSTFLFLFQSKRQCKVSLSTQLLLPCFGRPGADKAFANIWYPIEITPTPLRSIQDEDCTSLVTEVYLAVSP